MKYYVVDYGHYSNVVKGDFSPDMGMYCLGNQEGYTNFSEAKAVLIDHFCDQISGWRQCLRETRKLKKNDVIS